jgi:hypothetical protein
LTIAQNRAILYLSLEHRRAQSSVVASQIEPVTDRRGITPAHRLGAAGFVVIQTIVPSA